ncbi:PRC-barrel domain-containing protein [Archangium violaceum]|uniref:PRC-barrel domain-containing protein n=1 Tax=Archangium violaceum TaxID=83451 RepID=UPI001951F93F|nr:PRC-barrel domain-containing protein [Archangium violaceum]QRN98246.1 PRC-barrel domain-containing protein [Archangium violaceum]
MVERSELHEGMPVFTHRGEKLGHVVEVTDEELIVEKGLLVWRKDYAVPLDDVREIIADEVHLLHGPDSLLSGPREIDRSSRRTTH